MRSLIPHCIVLAPQYIEVYNNSRNAVGLEGAKEHVLGIRKTYPDPHLTIERKIAEGEWVATRATLRHEARIRVFGLG